MASQPIHWLSQSLLPLLAFALLIGCGGKVDDGRPPRAKVSGIVKLDGQPIQGAIVRLESDNEDQQGAVGKTNAEGEFGLTTFTPGDGAMPGTYTVTVSKTKSEERVTEDQAMKLLEQGRQVPPPKVTEFIPEQYTDVSNSELTFTVEADQENELILDLKE